MNFQALIEETITEFSLRRLKKEKKTNWTIILYVNVKVDDLRRLFVRKGEILYYLCYYITLKL